MFLLNWYEKWLELRREYKQEKPCESCETLKLELAHLHQDNQKLLDRILAQPAQPIERVGDTTTPILPRSGLPWAARKQLLEANDRHIAKLMKEAPKPVSVDTTLKELENDVLDRDLDNAEREREAEAGTRVK